MERAHTRKHARRLACDCLARMLRASVACSHARGLASIRVRYSKHSRSTRLIWARVTLSILYPPPLLYPYRERAHRQRQGDMMMPAGPRPHFILGQPDRLFGRLDVGRDAPAHRAYRAQLLKLVVSSAFDRSYFTVLPSRLPGPAAHRVV